MEQAISRMGKRTGWSDFESNLLWETAEEAQQIALDHAGVKNAENVHTHVVSGEEHPCYNIHLTIEGVSYEYLIDGITGEILSHGQGGH